MDDRFLAEAPYRIVTERLVIRPYEPGDAPLLKDAVDSSLDHLRAYMPWAWLAPEPLPAIEERLRSFRAAFDSGDDCIYGLFTHEEGELVGGSGLHRRAGPDGIEIGYWIRASRTRQGLATEATAALTRVAFERCGVERIEIRVEPSNAASLRIPARLGYTHDATLRRRLRVRPDGELRAAAVFSLFADELAGSPCASAVIDMFDASGQRIR